jgi:hypothetical protein
VDSDEAWGGVGEGEEGADDGVCWRGSVVEGVVLVTDAVRLKLRAIALCLVELHDCHHAQVQERGEVAALL